MVVPQGITPSAKASSKTIMHRNKVLDRVRDVVSAGDSTTQLQSEVHSMGKEERKELLKEAGITIDIPAEEGVAMKADLALPWTKLRVIRR